MKTQKIQTVITSTETAKKLSEANTVSSLSLALETSENNVVNQVHYDTSHTTTCCKSNSICIG
jgi:hypothetical protein